MFGILYAFKKEEKERKTKKKIQKTRKGRSGKVGSGYRFKVWGEVRRWGELGTEKKKEEKGGGGRWVVDFLCV